MRKILVWAAGILTFIIILFVFRGCEGSANKVTVQDRVRTLNTGNLYPNAIYFENGGQGRAVIRENSPQFLKIEYVTLERGQVQAFGGGVARHVAVWDKFTQKGEWKQYRGMSTNQVGAPGSFEAYMDGNGQWIFFFHDNRPGKSLTHVGRIR